MADPVILRLRNATNNSLEFFENLQSTAEEVLEDAEELVGEELFGEAVNQAVDYILGLFSRRFAQIVEELRGLQATLNDITSVEDLGPIKASNILDNAAQVATIIAAGLVIGSSLFFAAAVAAAPINPFISILILRPIATFLGGEAIAAGTFALGLVVAQDILNIALRGLGHECPEDEMPREIENPNPIISPLIIDLDGDGVESTSLDDFNAPHFDIDGDGIAERVGWVGADDGLLALDRNSNGSIDNITELFGSPTQDGFTQLRELDTNNDGLIDENDDQYADLRIWQDANGDGVSQEGELISLEEAGIVSIDLNDEEIDEVNAGNSVLFRSTVTFADGTEGDIDDVFFRVDQRDTRAILPEDFTFDPRIELLPELRGSGRLVDLQIAMNLDDDLRLEVEALVFNAFTFNGSELRSAIESVLFHWANIENVAPESRGGNIDAQHLEFLEALFDFEFLQTRGTNAGLNDPGPNAGDQLEQRYQEFLDVFVSRFSAQIFSSNIRITVSDALSEGNVLSDFSTQLSSPLGELFEVSYDEVQGILATGDFTTLITSIISGLPSDNDSAIIDIDLIFSALVGARFDIFRGNTEAFAEAIRAGFAERSDLALAEFAVATALRSNLLSGTGTDDLIDSGDIDPNDRDLVRDLDGVSSILVGGQGDDTLIGRTGGDYYVYNRGDGNDTINDQGAPDFEQVPLRSSDTIANGAFLGNRGGVDRLLLIGVNQSESVFERVGEDLLITIQGDQAGSITILGHFAGDGLGAIEEVIFADNVLNTVEINLILPSNLVETTGGEGNQVVTGTDADDTLDGGVDTDIFLFGPNSGVDTIVRPADAFSTVDRVVLDFNSDQAFYTRTLDGNIEIFFFAESVGIPDVSNGINARDFLNDRLIIEGGFSAGSTVDTFIFNDGVNLSGGEVSVRAGNGAVVINADLSNVTFSREAREVLLNESGDIGVGYDLVVSENGIEIARIDNQFSFLSSFNGPLVETGFDNIIFNNFEVLSRADIASLVPLIGTNDDDAGFDNPFDPSPRTSFELRGSNESESIQGLDGDDRIIGNAGNDVIEGGLGDDRIFGDIPRGGFDGFNGELFGENASNVGSDTYIYNSGDGNDIISDSGLGGLDVDRLVLNDLNLDQVEFTRVNTRVFNIFIEDQSDFEREQQSTTALVINDLTTGQEIRIEGQFGTHNFSDLTGIEEIEFADGTVVDRTFLEANSTLVNDFRTFDRPPENELVGTGLIRVGAPAPQPNLETDLAIVTTDFNTFISNGEFIENLTITLTSGELFEFDAASDILIFDPNMVVNDFNDLNDPLNITEGIALNDPLNIVTVIPPDATITFERDTFFGTQIENFADFFSDVFFYDPTSSVVSYDADTGAFVDPFFDEETQGSPPGTFNIVRGTGEADTAIVFSGDVEQTVVTVEILSFPDLNSDDFTFIRDDEDLIAQSLDGSTQVTIANFYCAVFDPGNMTDPATADFPEATLQEIIFGNGEIWDLDRITSEAVIAGTDGNDDLVGTELSETIEGFEGDDTINAGLGDDVLIGGEGSDNLSGDIGSDTFFATLNDGDDTIVGGEDTDTYDASELRTSVTVNLSEGTANGTEIGTDTLTSIEDIIGGRAGDILIGDDNANTINGGRGDDVINGGGGDDLLIGGQGADQINGGDGIDTASYSNARNGVDLSLQNGAGTRGDADGDTFVNIENVIASNYSDNIEGNDGDNTITLGRGADVAFGNGGNDVIDGEAGNDNISGGSGNDELSGGRGRDTLSGGEGDDILEGGIGDDILEGGIGNDTYIWNRGDGNDEITDGIDAIGIDRLQVSGVSSDQVTFETFRGDLIIRTTEGEEITVLGQFETIGSQGLEEIIFDDITLDRNAIENSATERPNGLVFGINDGGFELTSGTSIFIDANDLLSNDFDVDGDALTIVSVSNAVNGTVELLDDGRIVFTAASGFEGDANFDYVVSDGNGSTNDATVSISVIASTNAAPIVSTPLADLFSAEDETVNFTLPTDAFLDADGDLLTLTATLADGSELPSWLVFNGATFAGTPPQDFNGNLDIIVTASDGEFESSDTFTLEITPVNDAPVATDESSGIPEDLRGQFNITSENFDVDGDDLTLIAFDGINVLPGDEITLANGAVIRITANNGIDFDTNGAYEFLAEGELAIENFTYTISDGNGGTSTANFVLRIIGTNDAPIVARPLADQSSLEDNAVSFTIPADTFLDVDGDLPTLTATLADGSAIPSWLVFNGATFAGTPPQDFNGSLDVVVTATDGEFEVSDTFTLDITAVNDTPIVVVPLADQSSDEDEAVSFAIPEDTFLDVDGDVLNITATLADGSLLPSWLSFNGSTFSGVPPQDFNGSLAVVVTATDGEFEASDTFTLEVTSVNDAPILVTPLADQISVEDEVVSFTIPADAFIDVDGDELTLTSTLVGGAALPIWLTFDAVAGTFSGIPPQDFNGSLDVVVTASDGAFEVSDTFTIDVLAVNDAPILVTPLVDQSSLEDETVSFTIPADAFSDVDGDALALTATLVDGSELPEWLVFNGSTFSGTPPQNFNGSLEVVVTASDGEFEASDTFTLEINSVNDTPILITPLADQSSAEDEVVSFTLPADAFSDVDGDNLTFTATLVGGVALPLWLTFDAVAGTFSGTPPQDFNGNLDITVTASDGEFEASDTFTLEIASANDAPILGTPLADQSSLEDEVVSFTLPADAFNDVDGDLLTLTATLADGSALPSWLVFNGSTFAGTPPVNFNGNLDVIVTASDGEFEASDTFRLSVSSVNDAPIIVTPLEDQSSLEDEAVSFTIPTDAFRDVDGDALILSATLADGSDLPSWLVFDPDIATFTGTPPENFNTDASGPIEVRVTASDGQVSVSDDFSLDIMGVNDGPVAADDTASADQDAAVTISASDLLANDTDIDGDELTISGVTSTGSGEVTINDDGNIIYAPETGFVGDDTFTYTITDGEDTSTATVTVTVTDDGTIPDGAIAGSDGSDFIGGTSGDDDIFGQGGNDFIFGGRGQDNIFGGTGNDIAFGGRGHDTLNGGAGNDVLLGGNGQDILNGDEGNDLLLGGRGADTISGGAGNDFLLGGRGRDTFIFNTGDGRDVIGDFGTGNNRGGFISGGDRITINIDGISNFEELMGFATQDGNHVSFDFGDGDAIILANTRLAALDRDAFTFF